MWRVITNRIINKKGKEQATQTNINQNYQEKNMDPDTKIKKANQQEIKDPLLH